MSMKHFILFMLSLIGVCLQADNTYKNMLMQCIMSNTVEDRQKTVENYFRSRARQDGINPIDTNLTWQDLSKKDTIAATSLVKAQERFYYYMPTCVLVDESFLQSQQRANIGCKQIFSAIDHELGHVKQFEKWKNSVNMHPAKRDDQEQIVNNIKATVQFYEETGKSYKMLNQHLIYSKSGNCERDADYYCVYNTPFPCYMAEWINKSYLPENSSKGYLSNILKYSILANRCMREQNRIE